ncbi:hypothetical protein PTSG_03692 [Salpingoeca rosetta]|uniref:Uncharacterized protein n=1 Tax=Salpingoeca rosetta (strain ATCC 50818 / BSB-021) TaxID=946362 RepID=F2U6B3_SALR5|nr:uncharacterized protein PTSG_03692 [Salpingoeca rosetta]EGD83054.1 hypothetical protein PTSG_03692 [Salpingoeca rosetta]|eukprot:XP_004995418.1 hypothetical protein PTSG_03692 [Salpingoeca rosetta]
MGDSRPFETVVQPGTALGPFLLGSTINTVIAFLKENFETFHAVDFVYNSENPLGQDLLLNIDEYCLQLRFDPQNQCLKAIEVYGFDNIRLQYEKSAFGGQPVCDYGFREIHQVFGITRADFNSVEKAYFLDYPGLRLGFNVPEKWVQTYAHKKADLAQSLAFPDGETATLSSLLVFCASTMTATHF